MALLPLDSKSSHLQHQEEEERQPQDHDSLAHNPSAPPDELFNISTTVDPSYLISLIRKLLPANASSNHNSHSDVSCGPVQGLNADDKEISALTPSIVPPSSKDTSKSMKIIDDFDRNATHERENEAEQPGHSVPVGEEAWEEYGCILWDLSASKTHAELMVQNLVLEVLLANLMVSQSVCTMEIGLGIIGNLACHEVPMKRIVSTNRLIELIVDQMFLDDAQCLCEVCRQLTVGLQSSEGVTWAEALQYFRLVLINKLQLWVEAITHVQTYRYIYGLYSSFISRVGKKAINQWLKSFPVLRLHNRYRFCYHVECANNRSIFPWVFG